VISLWLSVEKIFLGKPIGDRPLLLMGVLMILVGIQMFTTGLIGEMVIGPRMKETTHLKIDMEIPPGSVSAAEHERAAS